MNEYHDLSKHIRRQLCALEEFDCYISRNSSKAIRVSLFQELAVDSCLFGREVEIRMTWN